MKSKAEIEADRKSNIAALLDCDATDVAHTASELKCDLYTMLHAYVDSVNTHRKRGGQKERMRALNRLIVDRTDHLFEGSLIE